MSRAKIYWQPKYDFICWSARLYKGGLHERIKSKTGRGVHSYCHVTG